jgi:hypothetical protein
MLIWIPPSPATIRVCLVLPLFLMRFFPGKWFVAFPAEDTDAARPAFMA